MARHVGTEAPLVGAEAPASTEATMMEAWMLVGAWAEALWMALGARGAGCRTLGREQLRGADAVMPRRKATQPEGEAATRCDSLGKQQPRSCVTKLCKEGGEELAR